jgi:hypothetical protein
MAAKGKRPGGSVAVALMALHSRVFFEQLLKDPKKAMTEMVKQRRLTLTKKEMAQVVKLIKSSRARIKKAGGLKIWDHWQDTGKLLGGDWPALRDWVTRSGGDWV